MCIDVVGVTKSFGAVRALDDVGLTIPTGVFGLLGPNGAGKTTLIRVLAGVIRPDMGLVRFGAFASDTTDGRREIQRRLGYLPQDLGLYPDLTAVEFLDYVGLLKGMGNRRCRRDRVNHLLRVVGLADFATRRLKGFSGGMKRRLGIAQALLNDPRVLIVDEPTAGLDPEERVRFRNFLVALSADRIVVLSTHIIEDIAQTATRVAVLTSGRVRFQGGVDDLAERARGLVWSIDMHGSARLDNAVVVTASKSSAGTQYRVISLESPGPGAQLVEPNLEDGYLALTSWAHDARGDFRDRPIVRAGERTTARLEEPPEA